MVPITVEDLPEILPIEAAAYAPPWRAWSERMFRGEFGNAVGIQRGWREEGKIVGYVFAWILFDDLHVNNIAVIPGLQRRGIARRLMEGLMGEARGRGVKRVSLEVRPSNIAARGLYDRLGFRAIAERKGYYDDTGEDAIILVREI